MTSDYTAGLVSIEEGSRTLTGEGTGWRSAAFREGDVLFLKGFAMPLESVDSNTQATLYDDWPGPTLEHAVYRLRYQGDLSRSTAKVQALIEGLADMKGETGAPGANFNPDAIGLFAGRGDYDEEAEHFSFLSLDGDGDAIDFAVIFIRQGPAGSWSGPIPFQGPKGDKGGDGAGAITIEEDGEAVVAGAAHLDFREHFEATVDPEDGTRAEVRLKGAAIIALIDATLGSDQWQSGGSGGPDPDFPENLLVDDGVPLVDEGLYIIDSGE